MFNLFHIQNPLQNKAKCLLPDFRYSLHEVKVKVTQSCLTLCNPMDYIVHGILQARILEWVAFPFYRESSQPRNRTEVSCISGNIFIWASLVAQLVKNLPAMLETWVWSLGWEDPLEKGKATHPSILAWIAKTWLSDFDFHCFHFHSTRLVR